MIDSDKIQEITVAKAAQIISTMPSNLSPMLWGSPGIGKTHVIRSTFEPKGIEVIPVLAGSSEPTDFTGIPFPSAAQKDAAGKVMVKNSRFSEYLIPEWAWRASVACPNDNPLVIFLDDVVTATEQTQAALYKMVHERTIGGIPFRDNVRIIAAGNRVEDKSAAQEMILALGNRFAPHLFVTSDTETWTNWAKVNGIHPAIVSFLRLNPNFLNTFNDALKHPGLKAFATPRTWHFLSDALHNMTKVGNINDDLFLVTSGVVGACAMEFVTHFNNTTKQIPPDVVVKNPKTCPVPKAEDIDILHATVSSLEHFVAQPDNYKHWNAILEYSVRLPVQDLGIILARQGFTVVIELMDEKAKVEAMESPLVQEMFEHWGPFLNIGGE